MTESRVGVGTGDYKERHPLPEEGWEISSQREGGDSTRFAVSGHGWDGAVTVLGGEPVRVLLQLGLSEDG